MSADSEDLNRRMLRARDAMDRSFAEPLDVRAIAAVAHVSEAHFIRSFRAVFGETPHHYLQRHLQRDRRRVTNGLPRRSRSDVCASLRADDGDATTWCTWSRSRTQQFWRSLGRGSCLASVSTQRTQTGEEPMITRLNVASIY